MLDSKIRAVIEIHVHEAEFHHGAGNFCTETERNTLLGLNVNDQAVGLQVSNAGISKEHERGAAELDDDLRHAPREALAGAKIKRHAGPAPVIDEQFQGDESFCVRIGSDVRFAAVVGDGLTVDRAAAVLSAHHVSKHFFGV